MKEEFPEMLLKAADAMHWLGKYDESNALILLSRFVRARKIGTLDEFEEDVRAEESIRG